jgi:type I restriction enzyme S subunit
MSRTRSGNKESQAGYREVQIGPEKLEIPEEWAVTRVNDVASRFISGGTPDSGNEDYWGGEIPWTTAAVVEGPQFEGQKDFITQEGLENSSASLVPEGSILFGTRVNVANVGRTRKEIAISQDLTGIVPDENKIDPDFFVWHLLFNQAKIRDRYSQGSTIQGMLTDDLKSLPLLSPPLPEQHRIAAILSTVDEQIQQTEETLEITKEVKNGLRQDLVIEGIGHNTFKEFRIGPFEYEIPQSWDVTTVAECAENRDSDRIPVKSSKREDMDGEIPYYGASGCIDHVDDYLFDGTFLLIAEDGKNLLRRTRPISFKITGKSWVNNHAHILDPNDDMSLEYLLNYFEILKYDPFVTGMDQIKLNQTNLNRIKVPKPPLEEQERIAEILRSVTQKMGRGESRLEKLEQLKRGLMQDLLTGKVRVNAK